MKKPREARKGLPQNKEKDMKRTTVLLDRDEEMLADLCRLRNTTNESAIIREAILVLWQKNFGESIGNPIPASIATPIVSATVATPITSATVAAPSQQSAPAADQPERYFLCPAAQSSTGLYGLYADIEMLEEKLTAAGWATEWEEGLVFGTNPKYEGGRRLQLTIPEPTEDFA